MRHALLSLVGAAACGGPRSPGVETAVRQPTQGNPVPPRADVPEACPGLKLVFLPPGGVGFCTGPERMRNGVAHVTSCYAFDVDARAFSPAPDMVAPTPGPAPATAEVAEVRPKGAGVEACAPNDGRCTTITAREIEIGASVVNADASRLLLFPKKGTIAELWDLDVIQRLGTIPLRTADCRRRAQFIGGTLLLVEAESCERGAAVLGTLFDDRGTYLAALGTMDFDLAGLQPRPASPTVWSFLADDRLLLIDVSSGSTRGPFDLVATGGRHWRSGWATELSRGRFAAISVTDAPGRVAIIDPAGTVEQFEPPTCPAR